MSKMKDSEIALRAALENAAREVREVTGSDTFKAWLGPEALERAERRRYPLPPEADAAQRDAIRRGRRSTTTELRASRLVDLVLGVRS